MSKIKKFLFTIITVIPIFLPSSVFALDIKQGSLTITDQSPTLKVNGTSISEFSITPDLEFNRLNDFITYTLVLKNADGKNFQITKITDNNTNAALDLTYTYPTTLDAADKAIDFTLKYVQRTTDPLNTIIVTIELIDEDDNTNTTTVVVPNTGTNTTTSGSVAFIKGLGIYIIATVAVSLIYILFRRYLTKRQKSTKAIRFALIITLALAIIPATAIAANTQNKDFTIIFNNITLNGPYTVAFNTDGGDPIPATQTVNHGGTATRPLTNPSKDNFDFSRWVDENGQEYNFIEQVIADITLTAEYVAVTHNYVYDVIKTEATSGTMALEYAGPAANDSLDSTKNTEKVYYYIKNPNNNIVFGGMCWKMIRTTTTGGVKLLYNGTYSGNCNKTGANTQIGTSAYFSANDKPSYAGYMYNPTAPNSIYGPATAGSLWGDSIEYQNGEYILKNTVASYDTAHRYTTNTSDGKGTTARLYFDAYRYILLSNGQNADDVWEDLVHNNKESSTIKTYIDNWYANSLTSYTDKLEDIAYCSDRSTLNKGGWDPTETTDVSTRIRYINNNFNASLNCPHKADRFSVGNSDAKLTYPVALITYPEIYLAHEQSTDYANIVGLSYLRTGQEYSMLSPTHFTGSEAYQKTVNTNGALSLLYVTAARGVRPVVSLKPLTEYVEGGTGTASNPYVVK